AFTKGMDSQLPDLPIQYADFALWQRDWLQGEILVLQVNYWKQQLGSSVPVLELPSDRPRPPVQSFRGATIFFEWPVQLSMDLRELSHRHGVTLFMTLLAGFQLLLCRYTDQNHLLVGTPVANRTRRELEGLIGFFINTLVLRSDL